MLGTFNVLFPRVLSLAFPAWPHSGSCLCFWSQFNCSIALAISPRALRFCLSLFLVKRFVMKLKLQETKWGQNRSLSTKYLPEIEAVIPSQMCISHISFSHSALALDCDCFSQIVEVQEHRSYSHKALAETLVKHSLTHRERNFQKKKNIYRKMLSFLFREGSSILNPKLSLQGTITSVKL